MDDHPPLADVTAKLTTDQLEHLLKRDAFGPRRGSTISGSSTTKEPANSAAPTHDTTQEVEAHAHDHGVAPPSTQALTLWMYLGVALSAALFGFWLGS